MNQFFSVSALNQQMQIEDLLVVEKEVAVKVAVVPPASIAVEESIIRYGLTVFTHFWQKKASWLIKDDLPTSASCNRISEEVNLKVTLSSCKFVESLTVCSNFCVCWKQLDVAGLTFFSLNIEAVCYIFNIHTKNWLKIL